MCLAHHVEHPSETVQERGVVGFGCDGFLNHGLGFIQFLPALRPHVAEVVQRIGKTRLHFQYFLKDLGGTGIILVTLVGCAHLEVKQMGQATGFVLLGNKFGGGVVLDRIGVIFLPVVGEGGVILQLVVLLEAFACFLKNLETLVELVLRHVHVGEVVVDAFELLVEADGFAVVVNGRGPILVIRGQGATEIVHAVIGRLLQQDLLDLNERALAVVLLQVILQKSAAESHLVRVAFGQAHQEIFRCVPFANEGIHVGQSVEQEEIVPTAPAFPGAIQQLDEQWSLGLPQVGMYAQMFHQQLREIHGEQEGDAFNFRGPLEHIQRFGALLLRIEDLEKGAMGEQDLGILADG